jgi:hypothetical protein
MLKRTIILAITCLAIAGPCLADNLTAQLFPLTGEIRLRNPSASAVPFVFYSITSSSGALNSSPLVWKSITDTYDVSGNGFVDPTFNWTKISMVSTQLTEGAFAGPGGSLAAFRSVSLGTIWNPALYPPSHDLAFSVLHADSSPVTITTQFAIAGDYNGNGIVESNDYTTWRQSFGSTTNLGADGNLNGVVDAADYTVWRKNLGLSIAVVGSQAEGSGGLQIGGIVPEPHAVAVLVVAAMATALIRRERARRAVPRGSDRTSVRP